MDDSQSNPMTFIILEDEEQIMESFESFVKDRADVKLVGKTNSSFEAIKLVKSMRPEAVIIDLELPHGLRNRLRISKNF